MAIIKPYPVIQFVADMTSDLPDRFRRKRVWCPRTLMLTLMLLTCPGRCLSYRGVLDYIGKHAKRHFGWERMPSPGSLSMAREKLTSEECRAFLHEVVKRCDGIKARHRNPWTDRRCIAFDGTRLITRRSADTARHLPRQRGPDGIRIHHPQGLMVFAIDLGRQMPLDWVLLGKKEGERTGLKQMVDLIRPRDIVILDRGFPSREILGMLVAKGADFVARMNASEQTGWKEVQEFLASGKREAEISLGVISQGIPVPMRVRLVERPPQRGQPRKGTKKELMVLVTNLRKEDGFDSSAIIKMYGSRWGIETAIRELKTFIDLEPFHTRTVLGVEQEIAAGLIWMAMGSMLQIRAEEGMPLDRRVIRTDCLRAAMSLLEDWLRGFPIEEGENLDIESLRRFWIKDRPDRYYERSCKFPHGRSVAKFG